VLYVRDAGVVVKWFIPEVDSDIAHQLLVRYLQGIDTPVAPDLLIAECGNALWRRCRQGDITPDEATESLADLLTLNIPLVQATHLVQSAFALAVFSTVHFDNAFCNNYLRGGPIVYSLWKERPNQKEQTMRDTLHRYRAIRDALTQCYPGQLSGTVARHLRTLAALISGIVGSKSTQLPPIAAQVPNGTTLESRAKRFARWCDNAHLLEEVYFLP
jgi:predicted nucleic acid-binding protein